MSDAIPGGNSPQIEGMDTGRMSMPQSDGGRAFENPEDEAGIISDQDITTSSDPQSTDSTLGAEGYDDPPLAGNDEFVRGEVDVKEQMDRAIRAMDTATGRIDLENPEDLDEINPDLVP